MSSEANETTNSFEERRDWMGRDFDNVEIYGSDLDRETNTERSSDRHTAMLVGSAAVAAAAIATIVLIRRKRQRDNDGRNGYEYESEPEVETSKPTNVRSFRFRRLADRQLQRITDTVDDVIDA